VISLAGVESREKKQDAKRAGFPLFSRGISCPFLRGVLSKYASFPVPFSIAAMPGKVRGLLEPFRLSEFNLVRLADAVSSVSFK
jgi:hypothetical protein